MRRRRTVGLIEPCLPSPAKRPPAGPDWIHEIKHDVSAQSWKGCCSISSFWWPLIRQNAVGR